MTYLDGKTRGEVVIFPVVKRLVPMVETAPADEPSPAAIVLVDLFDVRAELHGPTGQRQLVLFEGGVARVRIRPEFEAMGMANAISMFPDDGHRAAMVIGMIAIAMVPNASRDTGV